MPSTVAPNNFWKQASEERQYSMDFSSLMSTSEAIQSVVGVTSELRGGGASDLVINRVMISGQTVTMWISGGTAANSYRIEVGITTDGLQTLEGDGPLKISN